MKQFNEREMCDLLQEIVVDPSNNKHRKRLIKAMRENDWSDYMIFRNGLADFLEIEMADIEDKLTIGKIYS